MCWRNIFSSTFVRCAAAQGQPDLVRHGLRRAFPGNQLPLLALPVLYDDEHRGFAHIHEPFQHLHVVDLQQRLHRQLYQLEWSHLLDGVVDLRVRAYDLNGVWMTNGYPYGYTNVVK